MRRRPLIPRAQNLCLSSTHSPNRIPLTRGGETIARTVGATAPALVRRRRCLSRLKQRVVKRRQAPHAFPFDEGPQTEFTVRRQLLTRRVYDPAQLSRHMGNGDIGGNESDSRVQHSDAGISIPALEQRPQSLFDL